MEPAVLLPAAATEESPLLSSPETPGKAAPAGFFRKHLFPILTAIVLVVVAALVCLFWSSILDLFAPPGPSLRVSGLSSHHKLAVGDEAVLTATFKPYGQQSLQKDQYVVYRWSQTDPDGVTSVIAQWTPLRSLRFAARIEGDYVISMEAMTFTRYAPFDGQLPAPPADQNLRSKAPATLSISATGLPIDHDDRKGYDCAATGFCWGSSVRVLPHAPWILQYAIPAAPEYCSDAGCAEVRVAFRPQGSAKLWDFTSYTPLAPARKTHVLVAGLYAETLYELRHEIRLADGTTVFASEQLQPARTGKYPRNIGSASVTHAPKTLGGRPEPLSTEDKVLWFPLDQVDHMTDLEGELLWVSPHHQSEGEVGRSFTVNSLAGAGAFFVQASGDSLNPSLGHDTLGCRFVLRDLAGVDVRSTTVHALSHQLADSFGVGHVNQVTHDAQYVAANGHTLVLAMTERLSANLQPKHTNYPHSLREEKRLARAGVATSPQDAPATSADLANTTSETWDMLLELDSDFNVVGYVHLWDFVDTEHMALRSVTWNAPGFIEGPLMDETQAVSMTHVTSFSYDEQAAELRINVRNQDTLYVLPYHPEVGLGAGTARPSWVLQRDFALLRRDEYGVWLPAGSAGTTRPGDEYDAGWFSHNHAAFFFRVQGGEHLRLMTTFDNGVLRRTHGGTLNSTPTYRGEFGPADVSVKSRGKAFLLNMSTRTAYELLSFDLPPYSPAVGASQLLANGNYWFLAGAAGVGGYTSAAQAYEIATDGTIIDAIDLSVQTYRAFRVGGLWDDLASRDTVWPVPAGVPDSALLP
jgi:hypothetical protein